MNLLSTTKAAIKDKYPAYRQKILSLKKHPYFLKILGVSIVSIIIGFIITPVASIRNISHYYPGDIAAQTIYAPEDIVATDIVGMERNIKRLLKKLPPVFRYDPFVKPRMYNALNMVFSNGRIMFLSRRNSRETIDTIKENMKKLLGVSPSEDAILFFYKKGFSKIYRDGLLNIIQKFYERYKVIKNGTDVRSYAGTGILLITPGIGRLFIRDTNHFVNLQEAKNIIFDYVTETFPFLSIKDHILLTNFLTHFITHNVIYDKDATEYTIAKAKATVKPVTMHFKKGEIIVREGERIDKNAYAKLQVISKSEMVEHWYIFVLFYAFIFFITIFSVLEFSQKNIRKFNVNFRDGVFLSIILILTILITRLAVMLTGIHVIASFNIPREAYYYAVPIAFGGMIVRLMLNSEIAIGFSVVAGLIAALTASNNVAIPLYYIISGIVGAYTLAKCEQRSSIIKGGLIVSGVNMLLVSMFMLIHGNQPVVPFVINIVMASLSGITAAIMVTGLTPVFESLFGYATDMKLLELANLENPLLKDLFMIAPGSYNHSMMTATLAEAASTTIHANPLLVRVASYYHDIGKIKMPDYFIENQQYTVNKHDKLSPSMSSLIIISHVKEGKELARTNKIPQKIIDIISQHHGTSLVKYFYEKAKEKNGSGVQDEEYRYPGPKPQTKEAGIVMLADAVEASSRTLTEPTPAKIKAMVEKIVNARFVEGQLEECTLALNDLNEIKKSFVKILSSIFHKRVDYPGFRFNNLPTKVNGHTGIVQLQKK